MADNNAPTRSNANDPSAAEENAHAPKVVPREAYVARIFTRDCIEVGSDAVWSVSSAKHGNGVAQLRDDDDGTYWQSDESLPHTISIQFPRLTCVNKLAIHLNATIDESYTPKKIAVLCGTHPNNAVEVASAEVESPDGWLLIQLSDGLAAMASMAAMAANALARVKADEREAAEKKKQSEENDNAAASCAQKKPSPITINDAILSASTITGGADTTPTPEESSVWCNYIHILISENHQNGRDTHVRGVHVYGPAPSQKYSTQYFESYDSLR